MIPYSSTHKKERNHNNNRSRCYSSLVNLILIFEQCSFNAGNPSISDLFGDEIGLLGQKETGQRHSQYIGEGHDFTWRALDTKSTCYLAPEGRVSRARFINAAVYYFLFSSVCWRFVVIQSRLFSFCRAEGN
ncbi:hypothetical protein CEXT_183881 [Caerostris extrusa]|uniref:Uncharacterized protein n=1 Tax=Caerostris extrusa TaxID=172846 RepID=A0AAV4XXS0_CAEEX|nr:hypothetical protein CEXT_183881 [Caerostris extrusa]